MKFYLFFTIVLALSTTTNAQNTIMNGNVSHYLEVNGTMDQYIYAYNQLIILMENQFPKNENNSNSWLFVAVLILR